MLQTYFSDFFIHFLQSFLKSSNKQSQPSSTFVNLIVHWKLCHNFCFALQLARQGFKLVLISRTKEKLESLAVELSKINQINNKQIISC